MRLHCRCRAHLPLERVPRVVKARFDGPCRNAENRCDLLYTHLLTVEQVDNSAMDRRESPNSGRQVDVLIGHLRSPRSWAIRPPPARRAAFGVCWPGSRPRICESQSRRSTPGTAPDRVDLANHGWRRSTFPVQRRGRLRQSRNRPVPALHSAATAGSNAALNRLAPHWTQPGSAKPDIRQERARGCGPRSRHARTSQM